MSVELISPGPPEPDPHGQAALLLVESLIHSLVEANSLSVEDAVATIEVARDAHLDLLEANRSPHATTALLEDILNSIVKDLPQDPPYR